MGNSNNGHKRVLWLVLALLLTLTAPVMPGSAQQAESHTIAISQNVIGELTATNSAATYFLTALGGEMANVQVLAATQGFAPSLHIYNPADVEILALANPDGLTSLNESVHFLDAGVYTVEVSGENNTVGQFILSLQPGASLPEAAALPLNQPVVAVVDGETPLRAYRFRLLPEDSLLLSVLSATDADVRVSLYDEDAGRTVSSSDTGLSGTAYRFPPGARSYRLEVSASAASDSVTFTICLGACGDGLLSAAVPSEGVTLVETPEVAAEATCQVFSNNNGAVNLRSGPGTQYAIVGSLASGQSYPVIGQFSGWFEVSLSNAQSGWVSAAVTRLEGDCTGVPQVAAPVNAPLAPTPLPAPTQPPVPQPTSGGGANPTSTPREEKTLESEPTPTPAPAVLPDLSVTITGFSIAPDGMTSIAYFISNAVGDVSHYNISVCVLDDTEHTVGCTSGITGQLGAGQSISQSRAFQFNYDANAPLYIAYVTVDGDNQVVENNEVNNVATATCKPQTLHGFISKGPCT